MTLTKEIVQSAILRLGYTWYSDVTMIVGIRSALNVPNVFNDILCLFMPDGTERYYPITTEPGTTYLVKPINGKGCAVLKEGQYLNVWQLGFHQGKPDHKALRQCGMFTVYRDNDKDEIAEPIGIEDTGSGFGINCHGANKNIDTTKIGPWSAGCQVFSRWGHKEEMMGLLESWEAGRKGIKYHYTLINERDL
jgi:hypothetical protein